MNVSRSNVAADVLRVIDARFMAPAPAERLATLRVLVGAFSAVYLVVRGQVLADFRRAPGRFAPVGIVAWLDAPLPVWLVFAVYLAAVAASVAFCLGVRFRGVGPVCALLVLWVTSYRNSFGMVFHTDNLLVLHLAILAQSDAAAALSVDARSRQQQAGRGERFGWPVRLMTATTAVTYLLAAIAKLKITGWHWLDGDVLRNYVAYDGMRKSQIGSVHSPLGGLIVQYAWPFPILSVFSMLLELSGPIAALFPRLARAWAIGLYGFHVGVLATMTIAFPYPLSGVAFASVFECERLWRLAWLRRPYAWLAGGDLRAVTAGVR